MERISIDQKPVQMGMTIAWPFSIPLFDLFTHSEDKC